MTDHAAAAIGMALRWGLGGYLLAGAVGGLLVVGVVLLAFTGGE